MAADPLDDQVRVELGRVGVTERPLGSPVADRPDDRAQIAPGLCQVIQRPLPVGIGVPLDQADPLQVPEALGEDGPGDAGQEALQLVEALDPEEHLPDDQQRPAVAEHLGPPGQRAVLPVPLHVSQYRS